MVVHLCPMYQAMNEQGQGTACDQGQPELSMEIELGLGIWRKQLLFAQDQGSGCYEDQFSVYVRILGLVRSKVGGSCVLDVRAVCTMDLGSPFPAS